MAAIDQLPNHARREAEKHYYKAQDDIRDLREIRDEIGEEAFLDRLDVIRTLCKTNVKQILDKHLK